MHSVDHREEHPSYFLISIGPTILKTRDADPILLIQYYPTVGPPSASLAQHYANIGATSCVGWAP